MQISGDTDHGCVLQKYIDSSSIHGCVWISRLLWLASTSEQTADHIDKEHPNQQSFEHCPASNLLLLLLLLWWLLSLNLSILTNNKVATIQS